MICRWKRHRERLSSHHLAGFERNTSAPEARRLQADYKSRPESTTVQWRRREPVKAICRYTDLVSFVVLCGEMCGCCLKTNGDEV